jgi:hypothetical protein
MHCLLKSTWCDLYEIVAEITLKDEERNGGAPTAVSSECEEESVEEEIVTKEACIT